MAKRMLTLQMIDLDKWEWYVRRDFGERCGNDWDDFVE